MFGKEEGDYPTSSTESWSPTHRELSFTLIAEAVDHTTPSSAAQADPLVLPMNEWPEKLILKFAGFLADKTLRRFAHTCKAFHLALSELLRKRHNDVIVKKLTAGDLWTRRHKKQWQNIVTLGENYKTVYGIDFPKETGIQLRDFLPKIPESFAFAANDVWNKVAYGEPSRIPQELPMRRVRSPSNNSPEVRRRNAQFKEEARKSREEAKRRKGEEKKKVEEEGETKYDSH